MWCRICGQDVPGIPSSEEGKWSCVRCGELLAPISPQSAVAPPSATEEVSAQSGAASTAAQRPPFYDGWEIGEQLRHLRWVLSPPRVPREKLDEPTPQTKFRLDSAHRHPVPHLKRARRSSKNDAPVAIAPKRQAWGSRLLAALAWTMLLLGTTGFISGLALLGWSMDTQRPDLWAAGAPTILTGQIILILGLVLQLDRIWRGRRNASAALETVDEQPLERKTGAARRGALRGPSAAFYAHWAKDARPEILLDDLKRQLDLLAVKLSNQ